MENNLDQNIREKLQEREIQPSASAWERLSTQLDDAQQKKKRGWFLYIGYAASILLIVSLVLFYNQKEEPEVQNFIVQPEVKTPEIDKTIDFKTPVQEDEVIVQTSDSETKDNQRLDLQTKDLKTNGNAIKNKVVPKSKVPSQESVVAVQSQQKEPNPEFIEKKFNELKKTEQSVITENQNIKQDSNKINSTEGIYVDSEALLLSVTSTREELRTFYQKYKVDRAEVLATIQDELKKSNLKIDPNTILAEVEKDVNEESFQNNFYQFIKKRVSGVATAIANRNN